ncbi:MAG: hypothetical protein IJX42_02675 [Oscillospiraceae bacterium]|nr:hypothetical protein [Oscillospiraceae bacterium]
MKLKKIFAALAATAVAATMSVSAFADVDFPADKIGTDGNFTCVIWATDDDGNATGLLQDKAQLTEVTGIKWTFTAEGVGSDPSIWAGGAFGTNSDSTGWATSQWCYNEDPVGAGKIAATLVDGDTFEVVLTKDDGSAIFTADDTFAQAVFQNYGGALTLDKVTLLGIDEIVTPEEEETPDPEETPDGDTAPEQTPDNNDNAGNTGLVGLSVAGLAVAGAAVVATKKRK